MTPRDFILCCCCSTAKEKSSVIGCPDCGELIRWVRHGRYWRYRPGGRDLIAVPRFRCLNRKCERATFSVLPHPCLRYKRHTLAFYTVLLRVLMAMTVGRLARSLGKSWTTIRRWWADALMMNRFLREEGKREPWGPCPCARSGTQWPAFTRDLYRACGPSSHPFPGHPHNSSGDIDLASGIG